jgi:hypothetical protein
MDIVFNDDATITIQMDKHIQDAIESSGFPMNAKPNTPAQKNLFDISTESTPLTKEQSETFHCTVDKLLYLSLRARPDILLATSFLGTRVTNPTTQDQNKLHRVLQYLHHT